MKRVTKFLNQFPNIHGRVWVDMYSLVALVRFTLGKNVDATTLGVILGAYVIHGVGSKMAGRADES